MNNFYKGGSELPIGKDSSFSKPTQFQKTKVHRRTQLNNHFINSDSILLKQVYSIYKVLIQYCYSINKVSLSKYNRIESRLLNSCLTIPSYRIWLLNTKTILLLGIALFHMFSLSAQTPRKDSGADWPIPLQIGDTIPEWLRNMHLSVVNHPQGKEVITLNDYKGKLIILDFWATWCSSCIKMFPTLHGIQNRNKESVQILLINSKLTRDKPKEVKQFLSKKRDQCNFPSIVEDTTLGKFFPHKLIPHYVWIKQGKLLAVTVSEDITDDNIRNALNGKNIKTSYVPLVEHNISKPLFEEGNGGKPSTFIYKSFLAPYQNNLTTTTNIQSNEEGNVSRITLTNAPLFSLYRYAYPILSSQNKAQIIFNVKDTTAFNIENLSNGWMAEHAYNYEAQFPPTTPERAREMMRSDLQRFFGYKVTVNNTKPTTKIIVSDQ
ncbi:MAG: TlpA family protein disulfide reductase [Sphingobacterium sp.]|nr:TlpA family protein disulfide reductase [Sphingobacterium sp.]